MLRLFTIAGVLAVALHLSGCADRAPGLARARKLPDPDREKRKQWSGISYADQTVVEMTPRASTRTVGFDSERVMSGQDDWEPWVAVDPGAPYVYQFTTRYNPVAKIAFRRSSDGGATWDIDGFIPDTRRSQNDPQAAVAADGTLFVVWLDRWDTTLIKSSDHGMTWTSPVRVFTPPPSGSDHGWLAISPDGQDVYVGFNWSDSFVVASHDGGATFGPEVQTNDDNRYWFHTGAAVAPDGTVYIAVVDFSQDYAGSADVGVLKSDDGGLSWSTHYVDTVPEMPECGWAAGCYFGFFGSVTGLAVDAAGTIVLVYPSGQYDGGPQGIYARTSSDGVTWSNRTLISHRVPASTNAVPAVAAGPLAGDFRVAWQGTRTGDTDAWNTWYRRTLDGGASWGPFRRLSDLGTGAPYKSADGYRFPYGDYMGIAVDGEGVAHVIWAEGASYLGPGGTWYTRGQ